jgi:hypothetical protein
MELIPTAPPVVIPLATQVAEGMIHDFNADLAERIHRHRAGFSKFWDNPLVTPDEILVGWGPRAVYMLMAASESLQHIGRLAGIIGKTLDDFIAMEHYEPRRQFIPAQDGTVTLAPPADGFDAWGNPIPTSPDPLPE